ncbi:MAG: TIGR02147 family protein [Bdellovibrionota bacterium]
MTNAQHEIKKLMVSEWTKSRSNNPSYSLRALARKLRLPPSAVSEIIKRNRRITAKMAEKILRGLCVDSQTAQGLIVECAKPIKKKTKMRPGSITDSVGPNFAQLTLDQFHVISDWYCTAILALAETEGFKSDINWIAGRFGVATKHIECAIERLLRLGLLEKTASGKILSKQAQFTTPSDIADPSIRKSHFENLELARRSLEVDPVEARDFSIMTIAADPELLPEAKKRIKAFRRELMQFLESGKKREVFRLSIQLFGLSRGIQTKQIIKEQV